MATYKTVDKGTFTEVGKWVKEKITELNVDNKVDKVEGSSLATEAQLAQIETNKTDIAGLKTSKADVTALEEYATTESLAGYATTGQLDGKVDKVEGSSLATAAQLAQIETNKTDIASLQTDKADKTEIEDFVTSEALAGYATTAQLNGKVDKVEGSSLATSAQLTQIETNKTNIATINSDLSELATFLDTYA